MSNRSTWRRTLTWSMLGPGLGLVVAYVVFAGGGSENSAVVGYATGAMPLAAIVGAVAGWVGGLARERQAGGRASGFVGGAAALLGAIITAQALATIRIRAQGASGFLSLQALPYSGEILMLLGMMPAMLALGGSVGRWYSARGFAVGLLASLGAGVLVMVVVGPSLIAVAAAARIPLLSPPVVAALVIGLVALGRPKAVPA